MLELFFFFFNDTATTEIYTLSLHDALPISGMRLLWYAAPSIPNSHAPRHLGRHCSNLPSASRLALRRPAMRVHGDVRAIGVSAKLVELFPSRERWPSGLRRTLGKRV